MERLWALVGTGMRLKVETDLVTVALFSDPEWRERLAKLDETIADLPGFEGATLAQDALAPA